MASCSSRHYLRGRCFCHILCTSESPTHSIFLKRQGKLTARFLNAMALLKACRIQSLSLPAFHKCLATLDQMNFRAAGRIQPVDATSWLNRSAGVS
jgi:hypothetical protein